MGRLREPPIYGRKTPFQVSVRTMSGTPPAVDLNCGSARMSPPVALPPRIALFIDADNQSPRLAGPLVRWLKKIGSLPFSATIAGISATNITARWRSAMLDQQPKIQIDTVEAACVPDAADAALIIAMGMALPGLLGNRTGVVIASRDFVLTTAAAHLRERGIPVAVCYSSPVVMSWSARVPTCVLHLDGRG